jgi:uncharacterized protein (DUF58 family)
MTAALLHLPNRAERAARAAAAAYWAAIEQGDKDAIAAARIAWTDARAQIALLNTAAGRDASKASR